jgi:hypothetical protein
MSCKVFVGLIHEGGLLCSLSDASHKIIIFDFITAISETGGGYLFESLGMCV